MAQIVNDVFNMLAVHSLLFLCIRQHIRQIFNQMAEVTCYATRAEDKSALPVLPVSGCRIRVFKRVQPIILVTSVVLRILHVIVLFFAFLLDMCGSRDVFLLLMLLLDVIACLGIVRFAANFISLFYLLFAQFLECRSHYCL